MRVGVRVRVIGSGLGLGLGVRVELLAEVGVGVASPHGEGFVVRRVVTRREGHEAHHRTACLVGVRVGASVRVRDEAHHGAACLVGVRVRGRGKGWG